MKNKKTFIKIISIFVVLFLIGSVTFIIIKSNRDSKTVIGFYNIPENCYNAYEEIITKENKGKIKLIKLDDKDISSKKITKKIDMLITYNGAVTQNLLPKATTISKDIMSRFPMTFSKSPLYNYNGESKIFPITLDMFETMVLTTAITYYDLPEPDKTTALIDFGEKAGEFYPIPITLSGSNDLTINSFFSQIVEAFGGERGYANLLNQLKKDNNLDNFYNYVITYDNKTDSEAAPITVSTILDLIKSWEKNNILNSSWRIATSENTNQLIEDNRIAMTFMTLSEHRKITSDNISYYEQIFFPDMPEYSDGKRFCIQSAIVGMIFRNTPQTKIISSRLTTTGNQESISMQTQLGPATLQGTPFDRQADNCRFFAASFPGGPVPDLATLAFQDKEMQHKMAEMIRNY